MNGIKVNIEITFSKIMALLILGAGCLFAFWIKDAGIVYATFGIITALLVNKQVQDRITEVKTTKNESV